MGKVSSEDGTRGAIVGDFVFEDGGRDDLGGLMGCGIGGASVTCMVAVSEVVVSSPIFCATECESLQKMEKAAT
ncbi:MAG: hypothetical protein AAF591_08090 [Verrucomicrobiota bacterium]